MVAQSSGAVPPPTEMIDPPPLPRTKKKRSQAASWVHSAKSRATGTLRKTFFGKNTKNGRARDAEDVLEEDDYTSSNYDTVRSLPASGHYGRSRVGHLHVDTDHHLTVPTPPVIILKLPKRRPSQPSRISPGSRVPVADPVFDFQAWHSSLDDSEFISYLHLCSVLFSILSTV